MYKIITIITLMVSISCAPEPIDDVVLPIEPVQIKTTVEATPVHIATQVSTAPKPELTPVHFEVDCYGIGTAKDGPHKVSVAYEDCNDKYGLTASNIATLTKTFTDVWRERGYPKPDVVEDRLDQFLVISVHTEDGQDRSETMAGLKYPDLEPEEALDKLGDGDAFCYPAGFERLDISNGRFVIVLGSHILTERWADIVVHEIAHGALFTAHGDADSMHERDDIWNGLVNQLTDQYLQESR